MKYLKSKTIWAAFIVALLPYSEQLTGIAAGISPTTATILSVVFILLRVITTMPLSEK